MQCCSALHVNHLILFLLFLLVPGVQWYLLEYILSIALMVYLAFFFLFSRPIFKVPRYSSVTVPVLWSLCVLCPFPLDLPLTTTKLRRIFKFSSSVHEPLSKALVKWSSPSVCTFDKKTKSNYIIVYRQNMLSIITSLLVVNQNYISVSFKWRLIHSNYVSCTLYGM